MVSFDKNTKNLNIPSSLGNFQSNGGGGGVTPQEVQEMINSSITSYDVDIQEEFNNTNSGVSQNAENIETLSGVTQDILNSLENYATTADTSAITENVNTLSALTSAITEDVNTLSAATSGIAFDLQTLSAYTETIATGSTVKSYVLNLMTQEELAALFTDLNNYTAETTGNVSTSFPVDEYLFYYIENNTTSQRFQIKGSVKMEFAAITANTKAVFEGLAPSPSNNTTVYKYTFEVNSDGTNGDGRVQINYSLPKATDSVLGGVKIGSGLTVDNNGVLSVSGGSSESNYIIVDALSAVTNPYEGLRVYDKSTKTEYFYDGTKYDFVSELTFNLDAMTQQERADLNAYLFSLPDTVRKETAVYRDNVLCRYQREEGDGSGSKIWYQEMYPEESEVGYIAIKRFALKANGSYENAQDGKYAVVTLFDVNYTGHTISRVQASFYAAINYINGGDARIAINMRMKVANNQYVLSRNAWVERTGQFTGIIGGEWYYNGLNIKGVWNIVENSATLASWTEMPEITAIGNGLTVSGGTLSVSGGSAGEQFTIYNLDEMTQQELIALYNMITGTTSADTVNASNMFIKTFSEGTIGPLRLQLITNDYYGRIVFGAAFNNPYDENVVWAAEVWINGEGSIETAKFNTIRGVSKNTDYAGYFDSVSNPLVYDKGTSGFTDSEGTPIVNGQNFGGSFYWFVVVPLQGDWGQAIPLLPFKVIDENDVETMYYHPTTSTKEIADTVIDGVTYTKIFTARYADFKVSMYVNDNPKTANHTFVEI